MDTEEKINNIDVNLKKIELELLLISIREGLFKGEYVELLYNLTLKLQKAHLDCKLKQPNNE